MILFLQIILPLVLLYVIYRYLILFQIRKKLSWVPSARLLPIVGSCYEFGKNSSDYIERMNQLLKNPSKSIYFEFGLSTFGIATKNEELMGLLLGSNKPELNTRNYHLFAPWLGDGLTLSNGTKWKNMRRIITPAFHFSILEQFVKVFESNGDKLVYLLRKKATGDQYVDVYSYVTKCILDIISESAMGVSTKFQEGNNQQYVDAVKGYCQIVTKRLYSMIYRNEHLFKLNPDYKEYKRCLKILHDFTDTVIANRVKELENEGNIELERNSDGVRQKRAFLDILLNSAIDGRPLSKEEIREQVDTFMFGGHDTSSFAISMTLYLLATHPEIQTQARNEQKELFGSNRDQSITLQDLGRMKYLDLIIKESLRLYAPIPLIERGVTKDVEYKGHIIPNGTSFLLDIYGINRDPDYHERPDEFIPERHLKQNRKYFSYIPFSAGPRNCIGQRFAMLEMKSVISKILRNFEILPGDPDQKPLVAIEIIFKIINGVNLKLKSYEWE